MKILLDGNVLSEGYFNGILGDGISGDGVLAGSETPAGFLNNDFGVALPVYGGLTAAFSSNNSSDQLAAFFLNEDALGGSRDTSQPGIKVQLDARGSYGMFQIHTQLAGSNTAYNPFQIDDANNVRCNPDASGRTIVGTGTDDGVNELQVSGSVTLDTLKPNTTSAPSSPSAGWIYFDGTDLKFIVQGLGRQCKLFEPPSIPR